MRSKAHEHSKGLFRRDYGRSRLFRGNLHILIPLNLAEYLTELQIGQIHKMHRYIGILGEFDM